MDAGTSRLKKPKGRTLAEFRPLNPAEETLLRCAATGISATIAGKRPERQRSANTVRADFIRFLALGGDDEAPVHATGLFLAGAWIDGDLDLRSADTCALSLTHCHFAACPQLRDTRVNGTLRLTGSEMRGLHAERIDCASDLVLDDAAIKGATAWLTAALVRGNLYCRGTRLENPDYVDDDGYYVALFAEGLIVEGDVELSESHIEPWPGFTAAGCVWLRHAQIKGNLRCRGATLKAVAKPGDGADEPYPTALDLQGARIHRALHFHKMTYQAGRVDLGFARAWRLVDDPDPDFEFACWPKGSRLRGFSFDGFAGDDTELTARYRLAWLDRQPDGHCGRNGDGEAFRPQPWLHLRDVFRRMGHYEAAREVGIAFERRKRACGLVGRMPEISLRELLRVGGRWVYGGTGRLLHMGYGGLVGYGYRPLRLLMITAVVWIVCGGVYFAAAQWDGAFVPTAQVLFSRHGAECGLPAHTRWTACTAIERSYPQFYPAVYSLNVLLPVGKLGQQSAWQPETASWGGWLAQMAVWFETLFGWVASLVLVAVVSGLAKKDE